MGFAGPIYGLVSSVFGAAMVALAWQIYRGDGARLLERARHMFAFSILYLFVLFAVLLVERGPMTAVTG